MTDPDYYKLDHNKVLFAVMREVRNSSVEIEQLKIQNEKLQAQNDLIMQLVQGIFPQ